MILSLNIEEPLAERMSIKRALNLGNK